MPTYYLDPISSVNTGKQWSVTPSSLQFYAAINGGVRSPSSLSYSTYVAPSSGSNSVNVYFPNLSITSPEMITAVTLLMNIEDSFGVISATLYDSNVISAQITTNTTGWNSASWSNASTLPSVASPSTWVVNLNCNSLGVKVGAVYIQVDTVLAEDLSASYRVGVRPRIKTSSYTIKNKTSRDRSSTYNIQRTPPPSSSLTPLSNSYTPAVLDPWRPLITPGDFYIGNEHYYLYSDKRTRTLSDVTFSVFELAGVPLDNTITVTYASLSYTDFYTEGNELHLKHRNPEEWSTFYIANYADLEQRAWMNLGWMGKPSNPIVVSFSYLVWNTITQSYTTTSITQTFTVAIDEQRRYYKLYDTVDTTDDRIENSSHSGTYYPSYNPRVGPVVFTDDQVSYSDSRGCVNEFSIDPITAQLSFCAKENLVRNPAFQAFDGSNVPYEWSLSPSGTLTSTSSAYPRESAYGSYYIILAADQIMYQTIYPRNTGAHTISFYVRAHSGSFFDIDVGINPIDINGNYLDHSGNPTVFTSLFDQINYTIMTEVDALSSSNWVRHSVTFGTSNNFFTVTNTVDKIPTNAVSFQLVIKNINSGSVDLTAIQVEEGYEALPFLGLAGNSTIEYEIQPSENYVPDPSSTLDYPFKRDDIDLNSSESEMPNGFLVWQDDGSTDDYHLGKNGNQIYRAGSGPQNILGRFHFPYAKISGISKLSCRQTFNLNGGDIKYELPPNKVVLAASSISPILPESCYIGPPLTASPWQYGKAASYAVSTSSVMKSNVIQEEVHVETNTGKSIVLTCIFFDQFNNPVLGAVCSIVQTGGSGVSTSSIVTNRAGMVHFTHTPQLSSTGRYGETVVFSIGSISFTFIMDVI